MKNEEIIEILEELLYYYNTPESLYRAIALREAIKSLKK